MDVDATASFSRTVHVSYHLDWLPSDRATAVFGLNLPRLETTLTQADAVSSTEARRARSAARAEARQERDREREREDQIPRSTSPSGDLQPTPTIASTLTSPPSSAPRRSAIRSSSGAYSYSNLDIAVLVSLARIQSPTPPPSVRPSSPSTPKLALTLYHSASCLDNVLSDLLEFVNVPAVATLPVLRDHLLQSIGTGRQMPVATPHTELMADDPLWIAAALRYDIRRTIQTGAVHGDETSLTQSWFKRLSDAANQFVSAVAKSENDLAQSQSCSTATTGTRFAPSIWDGIAPNENPRPDLLCPNATFDAKASMSSLEAFSAVLRTAHRAELFIVPDLVPEDAVFKTNINVYDIMGEVMNPNDRHAGAVSLIVQVVTQMQLYRRRYGVVTAWNKGLVICRTGPTTFALSDWFMPTAPGRDRIESTTFAVLCALLLVNASSALDRERDLIRVDLVDTALEEVMERRKKRRLKKASQAASVRTNEASTSTHHSTADAPSGSSPMDELHAHEPFSSDLDSPDPSPITPNYPSFLDNHQPRLFPSSPSSSPYSETDMPSHPKCPTPSDTLKGDGALHISLSPILLTQSQQIRVSSRQHIPVHLLPTYHFDPIGECRPVHVELEGFHSQGRYWTAYCGNVGGKARVIVKICRLAAFADEDDDLQAGDVSCDDATSEIEHEMCVVRSRALASRITCAPILYGYWSGTRVASSGSPSPMGLRSRPMLTRDKTRLILAVMEDVGGEYSPTELHVKRDEIVAAFEQLHKAGFIHGDVAARHVRCGTDWDKKSLGRPRLIDFGRTRIASDDEIAAEQQVVQDMLARASWSSVYKIR